MRGWYHLWAIAFIAMTVAFAQGCDSEAAQSDDEQEISPSPVQTLVLEPTNFTDTFEVIGTAEARHTVFASAEIPGRVLQVYADEGDRVDRGQRLFRIDTEVDRAGLDVLETNVESAERELKRLEALLEEGLATTQQVDNARSELDSARNNLRQSRISVGRSTVRSPLTGHLAARMVDSGEFANAGAPLAEIIDYSTVLVYAQVPESQIRHVEGDTTVDVDIPALDETFQGSVHRISLRSSPNTRTFTAEVHIENEELKIRPGMRARVHFERQVLEDVILIPRDSILEGYSSREAMVVAGDEEVGPAEVRRLTTGPGTRDEVVVLEGLEAGDRLILRGHRGLIGDATVRVVDEERQRGGKAP